MGNVLTFDWKKLRRRSARVGLLLTSIFLGLLVLELLLRTQLPPPFVTMARTTTVEGLPFQLRPNFSTNYYGNPVHINSDGFRRPEVPAKIIGVRRIALIGHSITFGHVGDEDTLAVQLTAHLKEGGEETNVLNCGVPGYDADHVALMLEAQVLKLSPDVVVYVFCFNDPPLPEPTAPRTFPPDKVVYPSATFPLHSALLEVSGRAVKSGMRRLGIGSSQGYVAHILSNYRQGGATRLRNEAKKMQDLCTDRHIRILVAACPPMMHPNADPYREIEEGIKAICDELGLPFIDLREAFTPNEDLGRCQVSIFDNHPNGEANKRMAALLAKTLKE